jgi:hypothetical protein
MLSLLDPRLLLPDTCGCIFLLIEAAGICVVFGPFGTFKDWELRQSLSGGRGKGVGMEAKGESRYQSRIRQ